jgi:ribose transport system permease protein
MKPFTYLSRQRFVNVDLLIYLCAVGLMIAIFIELPQFRTVQNLSNLLLRTIPLLCVALGQMILLLIGGIDLSVGATLSLATAIASHLMVHSIPLAILSILMAGMLIGLINGLGATKMNINPFIMTLGTLSVINGVTLYIRPRPGGYIPGAYVNAVLARWGSVPIVPLLIFCLILIVGFVLLYKTTYGRHLYAIGGNEEAARLAGINVAAHKILAYVICGLFASLAGLYMTARITSGDPAVGGAFLLDSIGAVVMGGTSLAGGRGALGGTLFGVIVFSTLSNVFNLLNINIYWQYVFKGLIVISVVGISWARERR